MSVIHTDNFTDSNGTSLDAHTPDTGSGWTEALGQIEIQSNRAEVPSGTTTAEAIVETSKADVMAQSDIIKGDNAHGIIVRYANATNYDLVDFISTKLRLFTQVAGTFTERSANNTGAPYNGGSTYELHVLCLGSIIWGGDATNDEGVFYDSATDNQSNTRHGLRGAQGASPTDKCKWDNWQVEDLGAAGTTVVAPKRTYFIMPDRAIVHRRPVIASTITRNVILSRPTRPVVRHVTVLNHRRHIDKTVESTVIVRPKRIM